MQENLKINILPGENGSKSEVILRTGDALPVRHPDKYVFKGNIECVVKYVNARIGETVPPDYKVSPETAVFEIDKTAKTLVLKTNPKSPYADEVHGSLHISDEVKLFDFNGTKTFQRKELLDLVRFNKPLIDEDHYNKLKEALEKYSVDVNTAMKTESDNRGNINASYDKKVTFSGPKTLKFTMPIFKVHEKKSFTAELCVSSTDSNTVFFFESVELKELIHKYADELFTAQTKLIPDGYAILEK